MRYIQREATREEIDLLLALGARYSYEWWWDWKWYTKGEQLDDFPSEAAAKGPWANGIPKDQPRYLYILSEDNPL